MSEEIEKSAEFIRGMKDCADGIEHKEGQSTDYDRGYQAQYEHEQNQEYFSRESA